jgi:hypothetical protein
MRLFLFLLAALCFASIPVLSLGQSPALASPPPSCAEKIPLHGIHNAAKVSAHLFRMVMLHESAESALAELPAFGLSNS